jgi:hypothetical protein
MSISQKRFKLAVSDHKAELRIEQVSSTGLMRSRSIDDFVMDLRPYCECHEPHKKTTVAVNARAASKVWRQSAETC